MLRQFCLLEHTVIDDEKEMELPLPCTMVAVFGIDAVSSGLRAFSDSRWYTWLMEPHLESLETVR